MIIKFSDLSNPLFFCSSDVENTDLYILSFADNEHNYLVFGNPRFNPLKYVLMFNKLETTMKIKHVDDYYRLDVEEK